jgi:uncharacterized protein YbjQ (UPF0145 family)
LLTSYRAFGNRLPSADHRDLRVKSLTNVHLGLHRRLFELMSDIHTWITSANGFDGYRVVRGLGIVRGITVRSRSALGTFGASLQQIVGGNITLYTELAEQSRREAYELMIQHAAELGANAVIAMRYDATEVAQGVTEVLAYGTAVVIEPIS